MHTATWQLAPHHKMLCICKGNITLPLKLSSCWLIKPYFMFSSQIIDVFYLCRFFPASFFFPLYAWAIHVICSFLVGFSLWSNLGESTLLFFLCFFLCFSPLCLHKTPAQQPLMQLVRKPDKQSTGSSCGESVLLVCSQTLPLRQTSIFFKGLQSH